MTWNIEDTINDMNNSPAFLDNGFHAQKSMDNNYSMDIMDETDSHCFLNLVDFEKVEEKNYYGRKSSSDEFVLSGEYHYGADILEEGQVFCIGRGMMVSDLADELVDYLKSFRKRIA